MRLRSRFYRLLHYYLTARIDNYFIDDRLAVMEANRDDPFVCSIARGLYSLYDDTRRHLWLGTYSAELASMYAVWLYVLQSNVLAPEFQACKLDKNTDISFWPFTSFAHMREVMGSYIERKPFVPFYSPINNRLLINYNKGALIPWLARARMLDVLTGAIMCRKPEICHKLWKLRGLDSDTVFACAAGNGVSESLASRLIPEDGAFLVSERAVGVIAIAKIIKEKDLSTVTLERICGK